MVNDMPLDCYNCIYNPIKIIDSNFGCGVIAYYVNNDTYNILLAKRVDTGEYGGPGGKIEYGESPINAIKRECKEESNINLHQIQYLGCFEHSSPNNKKWLSFVFASNLNKGEFETIKNQKSEMETFKFYNLDEVNKLKLFPPTKQSLIMAIENNVFSYSNKIPYITCPDTIQKVQDSIVCQYSYQPPTIFDTPKPILTSPWIIWD